VQIEERRLSRLSILLFLIDSHMDFASRETGFIPILHNFSGFVGFQTPRPKTTPTRPSRQNVQYVHRQFPTKMNVSHTIKDKEVLRWQPLQRISRINLPKLTIKRAILLFLAIVTLTFLLAPSHVGRRPILTAAEQDEQVATRHRETLKTLVSKRGAEFGQLKQTVIFITAQDLYNASGLTALACEFATKKKMNVLLLYAGLNSTESIPFSLRANRFDKATCPMTWHDARHEFSTIYRQASATEEMVRHALLYLRSATVIHLDDEEEWFIQSIERAVYWRRPSIPVIQLKRDALYNLRWMASLSPSALAGTSFVSH
jgi:hypothetical protein